MGYLSIGAKTASQCPHCGSENLEETSMWEGLAATTEDNRDIIIQVKG